MQIKLRYHLSSSRRTKDLIWQHSVGWAVGKCIPRWWERTTACGGESSNIYPIIYSWSVNLRSWSSNYPYTRTCTKVYTQLFTSALFFLFVCFIYLFLAVLGLRCCVRALSSCSQRGLLFLAVHMLLIAVASLVAEHRLYRCPGFISCGTQAQ